MEILNTQNANTNLGQRAGEADAGQGATGETARSAAQAEVGTHAGGPLLERTVSLKLGPVHYTGGVEIGRK